VGRPHTSAKHRPDQQRPSKVSSARVPRSRIDDIAGAAIKRLSDLVISTALFILLLPLAMLLALAIKLESAGPVLYRSRRVGVGGREFAMLKFRKMHRDATGPALTSRNDGRLTRLGKLLARTKLDELPQLWNVICGDMSLVGPRPEDPTFVALYPEEFRVILSIRPGITGLSQLAFANEARILERPELAGRYADRLLPLKMTIDQLYIARRSMILDAKILVWTMAAVFLRVEVAVDRQSCRLSARRRVEAKAGEGTRARMPGQSTRARTRVATSPPSSWGQPTSHGPTE
jgi:lipopolysaccharide/colanic/teichoic acid biosynthesis glycosyltransferase